MESVGFNDLLLSVLTESPLTLSLPDRKNIIPPKTVENNQYRR